MPAQINGWNNGGMSAIAMRGCASNDVDCYFFLTWVRRLPFKGPPMFLAEGGGQAAHRVVSDSFGGQ